MGRTRMSSQVESDDGGDPFSGIEELVIVVSKGGPVDGHLTVEAWLVCVAMAVHFLGQMEFMEIGLKKVNDYGSVGFWRTIRGVMEERKSWKQLTL